MLALNIGQHHCAGDAIEHIGGGCAAAPLLQPGVPGRADTRALRHFFPPKSRSPPPLQRKAKRRGIELGASILQIGSELVHVRHPISVYTRITSLLYPNSESTNIPPD